MKSQDLQNFQAVLNGTYKGNGAHPYYACQVPFEYKAEGGHSPGCTKHAHITLKPDGNNFRLTVNKVNRHNSNYHTAYEGLVKNITELKAAVKQALN